MSVSVRQQILVFFLTQVSDLTSFLRTYGFPLGPHFSLFFLSQIVEQKAIVKFLPFPTFQLLESRRGSKGASDAIFIFTKQD